MNLKLLSLAPLFAAGLACAQSATVESTGQQLYFAHACYSCHGYTGETGTRDLIRSGIMSSESLFITYLRLRAEQNPILPSVEMPNYPQNALSDADARKLYAYIRTFRSSAPTVADIPAFREILDAAGRPPKEKAAP